MFRLHPPGFSCWGSRRGVGKMAVCHGQPSFHSCVATLMVCAGADGSVGLLCGACGTVDGESTWFKRHGIRTCWRAVRLAGLWISCGVTVV